MYIYIERTVDVHRSPMHTVTTSEQPVEAPAQVAPEGVIGPTALIRLFTVLAQRGTLDSIATWTTLPAGTSNSTSLGQVKQIASREVIRQIISIVYKRVVARRQEGHKRKGKGDPDFACAAYISAAELAAALIAFNGATKLVYAEQMRGVYNELVMCLGDAAQMALDMKVYRKALNLAGCALKAAEGVPAGDSIGADLRAKNNTRLQAAKAGLGQ